MSRLNPQIVLIQGIGLLTTSLLGTGIFVIPALAATVADEASLWAWMLLIALVLTVAFTFAQLGRHFPHAGGAPHLIGRAFGPRMERLSALLFLAVLPDRGYRPSADLGICWRQRWACCSGVFWHRGLCPLGEELKNPERDFPPALLFGVLLAGRV
jgi:amino acid transporter